MPDKLVDTAMRWLTLQSIEFSSIRPDVPEIAVTYLYPWRWKGYFKHLKICYLPFSLFDRLNSIRRTEL